MVPSLRVVISLLYLIREIADVRGDEWLNNLEIDRHLQLGRELLSQGLYDDALSHYHAAVEADPYNYLTYYTRATVYLAIGKIASALKDLSKVIEIKPDFVAARLQRGNVYLKQGRLDEAHIDYEYVLRMDPSHIDANHGYAVIEPLKRDVQLAYAFVEDHNYHEAIDLLTRLLQELPWDTKLREMRSGCYESIGDLMSAISDLRGILKSQTENQLRYLKLSELYYEIGETEESLNAIRECLRYDPDHKGCFAHYKYVKKIAAHLKAIQEFINEKNYEECVTRAEKAIALETKVPHMMYVLRYKSCQCLNKAGSPTEAVKMCTSALKIKPDDVDVLCERGDAYIANSEFSEAISDFQKASQINDYSQRAHDGLKRAQKLEKQSKKRNYYAILGVKRTAGKREILKAYRKLAQKWHPDNFQGDEKIPAEKKFIDIAAAKEVLTDPEKRQKFDNGEDPLDPESQQGFNPFQQGFNPFDRGVYDSDYQYSHYDSTEEEWLYEDTYYVFVMHDD
ncbi:dnaJ homolog subfamily C member 3 isoform X1 [Parasteatoda tepidariorum]|nr:dnaJ homolog subfamily C member 3 isoform X1 [Parasteatoda tepidariorum]